MDLDHIFIMIDPGRADDAALGLGLHEAYRRQHPGQGTRNICYALPDLFVEILWLDDRAAAESPAIARTSLSSRGRWRNTGACPLGVAWRGAAAPFPTWDFCPPYLPAGLTIPMACDSDDIQQPLLFRSPGSTTPRDWPVDRQGGLQAHLGLGLPIQVALLVPPAFQPCAALQAIMARTGLGLRHIQAGWGLTLQGTGASLTLAVRP